MTRLWHPFASMGAVEAAELVLVRGDTFGLHRIARADTATLGQG